MPKSTTESLAQHVQGRLLGPGDLTVHGLNAMKDAQPGELTFIGAPKFADRWAECQASAALIGSEISLEPGDGRALIVVDNPDLAMASLLEMFAPPKPGVEPGIHPSAVVDPAATLGSDVSIGAHCVIGPNTTIGDGCVLHPRVIVFEQVAIGPNTTLFPGVVVQQRCTIGAHNIIHANAVIGADGFGYRPGDTSAGQPPIVKVPHIGTVTLADHVEIGAGACIDRGKFGATTVGHHTKIDNLVQIGHNCVIGNAVLIAGCCGIAGSVTIGDGTMIGGAACLKDHLTIGRGVSIAGNAGVMDDIPDGETWAGTPAKPIKAAVREELAVRQLPELLKQYRKMKRDA